MVRYFKKFTIAFSSWILPSLLSLHFPVSSSVLLFLPLSPSYRNLLPTHRYKKVISACALRADIQGFPQLDFTIVGERGVSLSGGQKSRVALARAVYCKPAILLADDPLSAVDYNVAQTIFKNVFGGHNSIIKSSCRILVTHHVHLAKQAEQVVVLRSGRMTAGGRYEDLDWEGDEHLKQLQIQQEQKKVSFCLNWHVLLCFCYVFIL